MLADLADFSEIHQIKLMIRQIKCPQKTLLLPAKLNPAKKKNFHQSQN